MPVLLALPAWLAAAPSHPPVPGRLVFRGVTVVDVVAGRLLRNRSVTIDHGRILAVDSGPHAVAPGTQVVDAAGRYLIPGLWDMHVHLAAFPIDQRGADTRLESNADWALPLFLAHGVTGVRDMGGPFDVLHRWKSEVLLGERVGPRIVHTGWKLGGRMPAYPTAPAPVRTVADASRAVTLLADAGADFVKVEVLPLPELKAVIQAAHARGLPVLGHLARSVSIWDASTAGMAGVEHLQQVLLGCSSRERWILWRERFSGGRLAELLQRAGLLQVEAFREATRGALVDSWDSVRATALVAHLRDHGTAQTPTLVAIQDWERLAPTLSAERAGWLPPNLLAQDAKVYRGAIPPSPRKLATWEVERRTVRFMVRGGLPVLAGTDAPGNRRLPGASLQEELELFVGSGLTPLEALRSATLWPAEVLEIADSAGSVAPGRVADLVLLSANPLADIRALRQVEGVVAAGRYYARAALDDQLAGVRALLHEMRQAGPTLQLAVTIDDENDRERGTLRPPGTDGTGSVVLRPATQLDLEGTHPEDAPPAKLAPLTGHLPLRK